MEQDKRKALGDRLYEKYAKHLEQEHYGEYVAISEDGKTVIGDDLVEVADRAQSTLGKGVFIFKLGERAVGRVR